MELLMTMALLSLAFSLSPAQASEFRLARTTVTLRYVAYEFALETGADGVPRLNWDRFRQRPREVVTHKCPAVVLENGHFRATLLPAMGRLHSFVHKPTGHEQLWINPVAIPIPAHNDTGFWVTWGGVEHVLPRGEHGTSHALVWQHTVEEDSPTRKAVRMWSTEPLTGLRHAVTYAVYPNRPYLETTISLHNPASKAARYSHWTTALLAPGGTGQLTPKTEFIVPAERFIAADRPFNAWMNPLLGAARTAPIRFADAWRDIGDLMATPLQGPFYAAFSHERGEAVVRSLDLKRTPGFNIWTWGFPPSLERQAEYTAGGPNFGYVEFWNGTARDFTERALSTMAPGERVEWRERLAAVAGLKGTSDVVNSLAGAVK
jgi:hypothetical protein